MSIESVRVCLGSSLRAREAVRLRLRHLRQPSCFHSDVPIDWRLDIARNRHYWQLCGRQQHRWVEEPSPTDYVRRLLQSPALIGRLGGTEARCAVVVNEGELTRTGHRVSDCRAELSRQSGVRLSLSRYNLSDFIAIYVDAIRHADWLQFTCLQCREQLTFLCHFHLLERFFRPPNKLVRYVEDTMEFWRRFLAELSNAKASILVVTPLVDSIKANLPNLNAIHPGYNISGATFRFLRTPMSFGWASSSTGSRHEKMANWITSLEELKRSPEWGRQRSTVALLGCGAYGMPLAAHAKQKGMSAIYVGGLLQLLFGVRGARWDKRKEIVDAMNEHWTRPLSHEVPAGNRLLLDGDGAYWR